MSHCQFLPFKIFIIIIIKPIIIIIVSIILLVPIYLSKACKGMTTFNIYKLLLYFSMC